MITIHWIWIYLSGVFFVLLMAGKEIASVPINRWAKRAFWQLPLMLIGSWATFISVGIYLAWKGV